MSRKRLRSRTPRERAELLDNAFCQALIACEAADLPDDALEWANVAAAILAIDNQLDDCNFGWSADLPDKGTS